MSKFVQQHEPHRDQNGLRANTLDSGSSSELKTSISTVDDVKAGKVTTDSRSGRCEAVAHGEKETQENRKLRGKLFFDKPEPYQTLHFQQVNFNISCPPGTNVKNCTGTLSSNYALILPLAQRREHKCTTGATNTFRGSCTNTRSTK